ncbi:DUF5333 domain-containing protein [Pseudooceanicola sp.]|uniref:DUF5333 domain-containing protein n=1 Tax=Pseudooceanicola sp. TaxID=1914328 RepID=UPI0035C73D95
MRLTTSAILLALTTSAALAKAPLREVPEIDNSMFSVAMAIEISDKCASIKPRTLKGLGFLMRLSEKAQDMGYSKAEIDAYRKSDIEKARIRAKGEAYVRDKGLDPLDPQDLCKLGEMEMAQGSQIGSFLK